MNVAQDAFFSNVITKDIQVKSEGIRSNALVYYSAGQFYKFNTSFMRYIKVLTGVNENEMNDFVIKYFISSVIRKNYSQFVDDVKVIANEYALYDYNISLNLFSYPVNADPISPKLLSLILQQKK